MRGVFPHPAGALVRACAWYHLYGTQFVPNLRNRKGVLMSYIRITATPLNYGFVPKPFREAWLNLKLPIATDEELARKPLGIGLNSSDVHLVPHLKAVAALREAGRENAAGFWELRQISYLRFEKGICEVVE